MRITQVAIRGLKRAEAERETYRKAEQDLRRKVARANALKELRKNLRALRAHVIQRMIEPLHQQVCAEGGLEGSRHTSFAHVLPGVEAVLLDRGPEAVDRAFE